MTLNQFTPKYSLLYVRGSFVQVLEGEKAAVESLYKRIGQDHRHTDVDQVLNRPITQRLFGNWGMGYETIAVRQFEEIKAIINLDDNTDTMIQPDDHIIVKTIKAFYNSNHYN